MTEWSAMVGEVFAPGGVLARSDAHFQPREGQLRMAQAVARTMAEGGELVVEAGTGVGKTYAYLVPALLSGERVLLSTATKALQDQLFARDLPRLAGTLGVAARVALLKGRSSYLCLHRMEQARQAPGSGEPGTARVLAKVEAWAQATVSGDVAELVGLDERSPVLPLVTSTRENCLGSNCPRFRACHVHKARREALAADIVVINHHLFFADLAVRESGMAELLPTARIVVFDEAHQINETGVLFLGQQLSTGQVADFSRDLVQGGERLARGLCDWAGLAQALEHGARRWRESVDAAATGRSGARLRWAGGAPEGVHAQQWQGALAAVAQACARAQEALDLVSETAPDLERLYERASELLARLARFSSPPAPGAVRWLDVGTHLRLHESPLDIAHAMRTRVLGAAAAAASPQEDDGWLADHTGGPGRAWIFTSATLGDDAELSWFTGPAGLQDAQILRVASPFDYARQAALYVPGHLPLPADPEHSTALARWVAGAAQQLGGRTMVLTTTLHAMRTIGEVLRSRCTGDGAPQVLVQGEWPKRRLMERFRGADGQGQPGCVLVASATFWEGFDVPGDALQMVVIDKLPFPPPGDPLVEARIERVVAASGKAFTAYALPEAAVALQQGAGRLIRRETDRGILVVGDRRLVSMGYGKRLRAALPPMRMLQSEEEFDAALRALTRTSTTDPTSA